MIFGLILIAVISLYDINYMSSRKLYKEMAVFLLFALSAAAMAYLYTRNPYSISIAEFALKLFRYKQ